MTIKELQQLSDALAKEAGIFGGVMRGIGKGVGKIKNIGAKIRPPVKPTPVPTPKPSPYVTAGTSHYRPPTASVTRNTPRTIGGGTGNVGNPAASTPWAGQFVPEAPVAAVPPVSAVANRSIGNRLGRFGAKQLGGLALGAGAAYAIPKAFQSEYIQSMPGADKWGPYAEQVAYTLPFMLPGGMFGKALGMGLPSAMGQVEDNGFYKGIVGDFAEGNFGKYLADDPSILKKFLGNPENVEMVKSVLADNPELMQQFTNGQGSFDWNSLLAFIPYLLGSLAGGGQQTQMAGQPNYNSGTLW